MKLLVFIFEQPSYVGSALLKSITMIISRINEVDVFSIKYRYSDILLNKQNSFAPFVSLQSHLLLCKHGFCDVTL